MRPNQAGQWQRNAAIATALAVAAIASSGIAEAQSDSFSLNFEKISGDFTPLAIPDGTGGEISTGAWEVLPVGGRGLWEFDSATGVNHWSMQLLLSFPNLPGQPTLPLPLMETGPFVMGRDLSNGEVGVVAVNQADFIVNAPGTPFDKSETKITNINIIKAPGIPIPPFPGAPSQEDPPLPILPSTMEPLPPGLVPGPTEFAQRGIFALAGDILIPGVPRPQMFQGSGEFIMLPIVPGDYNGDGVVDPSDYAFWSNEYANALGGGTADLAADGNGDGVIDPSDYAFWSNEYAKSLGGGGPVPEPATIALVGAGGALLMGRRRVGGRPA